MAIEKRRKPRRRALKRAKAVSTNYDWIIDCVVQDLSATGAQLAVDRAFEFPSEFQVLLPEDQILVSAELSWCSLNKAGVKFRP